MTRVETLMMVDDDEIYMYLAKKAIMDAGITGNIVTMHNGKDALEFLQSNSSTHHNLPELIFLDLTMPIMDGWEFLEEYTSLQPRLSKSITLFVVSSSISPDDIERARSISSVTDYVIKPITKEMYIDIVSNIS